MSPAGRLRKLLARSHRPLGKAQLGHRLPFFQRLARGFRCHEKPLWVTDVPNALSMNLGAPASLPAGCKRASRRRGRRRSRRRMGSRSERMRQCVRGLSMNRPSTETHQAFESGAEDARTPNAVARSADSASAKRLECVRFIGAFRPAPRLGGSWSLCRAIGPRRLSMKRGSPARFWSAPVQDATARSAGSWSLYLRKKAERALSMNRRRQT